MQMDRENRECWTLFWNAKSAGNLFYSCIQSDSTAEEVNEPLLGDNKKNADFFNVQTMKKKWFIHAEKSVNDNNMPSN